MWKDLSMREKAALMKVAVKNGIYGLEEIRNNYNSFAKGGHIVKKGDSLWKIAHDNGVTLDDLLEYNSSLKGNINTVIHPGDIIRIKPKEKSYHTEFFNIDDIERQEAKINKTNLGAIQSVSHDKNYMVIDKKNGNVRVFSPSNEELYSAKTNTGLSKDDYNTLTITDKNGELIDMIGNNSTPAGITAISGKGIYHGVPSFTRARINQDGSIREVKDSKGNLISDNIASSMHFGNIREGAGSNGCVRIGGEDICKIDPLVRRGTKVYTLPEKEGSRFEVRDGKLNFFADNPYGDDTNITNLPNLPEFIDRYDKNGKVYKKNTEGYKKLGNDYNVHTDRTYNPLLIEDKRLDNDDYEYQGNVAAFANTVMNAKEDLQKRFRLDSKTYNDLAKIAMGIAEQETKFNTAIRKKIKDVVPDEVLNMIRGNDNRSRGFTQIKLKGDNEGMQEVYKDLGITEDNLDDADKSALATMARLAYMYNTEVRGRKFTGAEGKEVSPMDALLYKWSGHNEQLRNKTATPESNIYLRNVHKYLKNFNYYSGRKVEDK